jgi:4-amino-4-deoxy-L-arabinose transferase-like glycosyltransferase
MRLRVPQLGLAPVIYWLAGLAFLLRLIARLWQGIDLFWVNGYTFFFDLAQSIAAGKGIALADGVPTAFRVPLYPIFLAALTFGHQWFWPIVIAQSLIGAATVVAVALLAQQLFPQPICRIASILAAAVTAIYPYYIVHDTAMQETSLFTLLTLVAVLLALRAARTGANVIAAQCGIVLGLDVLTRSPIAPFAILVPLWLLARLRVVPALLCALLLGITVSPWLLRNYKLTGRPVLTTEAGFELWNGNNPRLFMYYPMQSVDVSIAAALAAQTPAERQQLAQFDGNERLIDHWYRQQAVHYIKSRRRIIFSHDLRKIAATFDWLPTPRRSRAQTLLHAISFAPVMVFGLWGMWIRRRQWRDDSLIYLLFLQFLSVTAIYFGQTNHRVFLDVYFIVYAAGAVAAHLSGRFTATSSAAHSLRST